MPTIEQILAALRTSRPTFTNLFEEAQTDLPSQNRLAFEAVTLVADDTEAYVKALQYAQANNFLQPLLERLINERQEDGSLTVLLANQTNAGAATLQAMVNEAQGFVQPEILCRGINDGKHWTGQITVTLPAGGRANGTCILIGPRLVLTAWHVVHALFRNNNGTWEPDPTINGTNRIQVDFDNYLLRVGQNGGLGGSAGAIKVFGHATDWCVKFSPCHQDELNDRLPADAKDLADFWDYAIIRLDATPGIGRRFAHLDAQAFVPAPTDNCILLQYPAAQTLRLGLGAIGRFTPPNPEVSRLRFLHQINTLPGSSGGGCYDRSFVLFGLHQGVWSQGEGLNRGIPMVKIYEHINVSGLPAPDPTENPYWELTTDTKKEPIIGLDQFQAVCWRLAMVGGPRLLAITGANGSGKTFCVRVLSQMLPDGGNLKIRLNAGPGGIGQKDARQLVADMCANAGVEAPVIPDMDPNSTSIVWLKNEVIPALLSALDRARRGNLVWILLTDLNKGTIDGLHASEFLFLLYEQILKVDWLRIVLDGVRADIPESLNDVTERFRIQEKSQYDIETYLRHFFSTLDQSFDSEQAVPFSAFLIQPYQNLLNNNPDNALKNLASETKRFSEVFRKADQ
ncbi:hypothetical protein EXU85_07930 [Spirosoma sp. KCTC 42546]|uniref:trypsin-like serine peptidase n=1 Tax=Spirosoma sp. KCTC 42546 TaxID=2520506 RepID=UPI00115B1F74|nr:trypsin-like peptidase domain-containing protein [Spirosoma sp. KCTC 42546]QDK78542.1 hypothetical protein EXU85_07930 [Spirosoma sp. KCTC 42546]